MKFLLLLLTLPLLLCQCVTRPLVVEHHPDGTTETTYLGGHVASTAENVLIEVKKPNGLHVKYAAKKEDSAVAVLAWIGMKLGIRMSEIAGDVDMHKVSTESATTLGLSADSVKKAGIKSKEKVILGTFVKPTQ